MIYALLLKNFHNLNFFDQIFAFFLFFLKNSQSSLLISKSNKFHINFNSDSDFDCILKTLFETRCMKIIMKKSDRMFEFAAM